MPIHSLGTRPPFIQVGLNVTLSLARKGRGQPLPEGFTALVDTGAHQTAIAPAVLARLGSQRVSPIEVLRHDGSREWRDTFRVRIGLEPNFGVPTWPIATPWFNLTVVAAAPATPGVDVLIGQDLLNEVVMFWDGPAGRLVPSY